MEQYIPKSALVAEIERRLDELYDLLPDASKVEIGTVTISEACNTGKYTALESFRRFIDTLEVREVDLDKYINKYFKGWYVDLTDQGNILHSPDGQAGLMSVKKVAKHFFELGMVASNKVQKGE